MEQITGASPRQLPTTASGLYLLNVPEVSTFRLYLLRAMYVFTFVGLVIFRWPAILNPLQAYRTRALSLRWCSARCRF